MDDTENLDQHVRPVAEESLGTFERIAEAARAGLERDDFSGGPSAFATINTFTSTQALNNRNRVSAENLEACRILACEPAIARVVVIDGDGEKTTFYFSRAAVAPVPDKLLKFASYRSRVGRLAELDIGDEYDLPRGGQTISVEVVERARFRPFQTNHEWDALNTVFEGEGFGPVTIESLRAALKAAEVIDETVLEELLREELTEENVRQGVRRAVISKMDLRDQPILDRYQGEIFRMPLDTRLLILGAPGTGKTTTLIRRLGQKLDLASLDEDDRLAIRTAGETDHAQSWLMFTPTELLRLYVKEAFNRENIPAPDDRIRTWAEYREELARNHFRILRSAKSNSSLVMKDSARTLVSNVESTQIEWFADFNDWQRSTFWEEMRASAKSLSENGAEGVAKFGSRVLSLIDKAGPTPQAPVFAALMAVANEIAVLVGNLKEATDDKIRRALNLQVNRNKTFLDEMANLIAKFDEATDDELEQEPDEEDEVVGQSRAVRQAATVAYMRAVRAQARARARKGNVSRTSPTGRLIEWLGDRTIPEKDQPEVGESLAIQSELRAFVNPVRRYIDGLPARYRRFRRQRQSEKRWYPAESFSPTDVHPLEVDLMLLAMMRAANELITGARSLIDGETPARATLERMVQLYQTQVLVDEATDFAPLQLACMAALARPDTRSFFACGDFNQRVTNWGTRSRAEMQWVVPHIQIKTVNVVYRQSRHLHELARNLVALSGGSEDAAVLSDFAENEGVPPVLAKGLTNPSEITSWLAQRIIEIEKFVGSLPSIAVLVNAEEEVRPIAAALRDALVNNNISVEACPDGRVRGRDGAVRVFNVQHIKGLEFEAVFFLGVDQLATSQPNLFDKYLYVGATRAATYLGLTCESGLPLRLAPLDGLFRWDWS